MGHRVPVAAQVGGPRAVRAGDDVRRVRRLPQARRLGGPGPALPGRCLQGAQAHGARRGAHRGAGRPHRVARASSCARSTRACSTSGSGCCTPRMRTWPPSAGAASTRARRRSRPTSGPSGCWCATPCSVGSSWRRCAAGTTSASSTPRPAGTPTGGAPPWRSTTPSTSTWAPGPRRVGRCCCRSSEQPGKWTVRQVFDDPDADHDWGISAEVDLAASDAEGTAVVRVTSVDCY